MSAIYLKDLAAKTRRGLEGRIRAGRCIGMAPCGYPLVRRLAPNGEAERGLREDRSCPRKVVVRRIFADYAAGLSPRSIAKALNEDAIPEPREGIWYDTACLCCSNLRRRSAAQRACASRLDWNQQRNTKNHNLDGTRVRRTNPVDDVVVHPVWGLGSRRHTKTWRSAQDLLALRAAPVGSGGARVVLWGASGAPAARAAWPTATGAAASAAVNCHPVGTRPQSVPRRTPRLLHQHRAVHRRSHLGAHL